MKTAMTTTVSRRAWLSRLFMVAALAPVVGVRLADDVGADKKTKKQSRKDRLVANGVEACGLDGGTATVTERPGGTTVACSGSNNGDWTCTHSSKTSRCHKNLPNPPKAPLDDVSTAPTDGVHEDPTDGGGDAGGGRVPPSGAADHPLEPDGGGSDPVLE